jgi:alkylhydroperoxidase family enzyme
MSRDEERAARAAEAPVVGGLPPAPGILAAMMLTPDLGVTLNKLANHLLVDPFPGATLSRAERELLATAVSASNDCFFCMDSHAAFACELLTRQGNGEGAERRLDEIKEGKSGDFGPKMTTLMAIARQVAAAPRQLTRAQIEAALCEGGDRR